MQSTKIRLFFDLADRGRNPSAVGGYGNGDEVEEGVFDEVGFVNDDEISLVGESVDEVGFVEEVGEVGTDEIRSEGEGLGGFVGAGGDWVAPAAVELFF